MTAIPGDVLRFATRYHTAITNPKQPLNGQGTTDGMAKDSDVS